MRARRVDHQFNLIQQLQPPWLQFVVGDALAQLPLEVEHSCLRRGTPLQLQLPCSLWTRSRISSSLPLEQRLHPFAHLRQEIEQHLQQIARQIRFIGRLAQRQRPVERQGASSATALSTSPLW